MEAAFLAVAIPPLSRSASQREALQALARSPRRCRAGDAAFEAAALLLPILIVQDVISLWVYRRDWSARNLQSCWRARLGIGLAWFLALQIVSGCRRAADRRRDRLSFVLTSWLGGQPAPSPSRRPARSVLGRCLRFTSAFANAVGPPFQIYMLPQRLPN